MNETPRGTGPDPASSTLRVSEPVDRPRVVLRGVLPGRPEDALAGDADLIRLGDGRSFRDQLGRADAIVCVLSDRIDAELLAAAERLRVVSSVSVGLDHIDVTAATRLGIPVGHTPGVLTETTADFAFGALLAAARRIAEGDRLVRARAWREAWGLEFLLGRDVFGATLGLIGLGAIGQAVARRAAGFEMRVLGWTPSGRALPGVAPRSLDALLAESDFVSVHVALTPATRGLLGAREIAMLRPHAMLVNTARAGVVDEDALVAALRAGRLAGAALDVFACEPLPRDSALLTLENVVLTPHIGSASVATRARMAALAIENVRAGLAGIPLPHCANPEVYASTAFSERSQRARNTSGETTRAPR